MPREEVLMVGLGRIEAFEWNYLGDDWLRECFCMIELRNVCVGGLVLVRIGIKNRRPVLRPLIGPLLVELGWIVRGVKKYFKQIVVGHL